MKKSRNYNEQLGLVIFQGEQKFYLEDSTWWILDYASRDPESINEDNSHFRNGMLLVDETNAKEFLDVIKESEVLAKDVRRLVLESRKLMETDEDEDEFALMFLVNFDKKLYVSGYFDFYVRPYEDFVPKGWKGILDNPLKYVPDNVKLLWD